MTKVFLYLGNQFLRMMKKIIIVRHAKSDWETGLTDFIRPLNKRGEEDAPKMSAKLKEIGLVPDYVLCSLAKRTSETASLLLQGVFDLDKVDYRQAIYDATFFELMNLINNEVDEKVETLLIIGHNPGVTELVEYLSASNIGWLPTCGMVCLTASVEDWAMVGKDTFSKDWYYYPKILED